MNTPRIQNTLRKADRLLELAPDYIRHPGRIPHALRGMHPATLASLDRPWLRDFGIRTVLDVGANTGQFAEVAHHVFPTARIISFEPLPDCVEALIDRMQAVENFRAISTAVGSSDGRITIHESPSSPSSSILPMTAEHTDAFPWTSGGRDIEVELHRLDHYLPELELDPRVLLKIDVQGYSLDVLRGATATLAQTDLVFVETSVVPLYQGEATFEDVHRLLAAAGFTFGGILDQLTHPHTGQVLQADVIFRKSGS